MYPLAIKTIKEELCSTFNILKQKNFARFVKAVSKLLKYLVDNYQ
jgi:hypothetical protein